ncbi:caspase-8-like [Saccoglossus kowalevskii]|uniref:Caspase-8-like n=1 Tax=Saccoglossus kowalevskii TaxID=10224 RepID=A0ABM0MQZ9_SACKO|nr:PREDICTED: caspase-8-like [Saccoglossus kowalevskii]
MMNSDQVVVYDYNNAKGSTELDSAGMDRTVLTSRGGRSDSPQYAMNRSLRGLAVIIANVHFNKDPDNPSSVQLKDLPNVKYEADQLYSLFTALGYIVCIYPDVTSEQLIQKSETYSRKNHSAYDSFICCIMSRGTAAHVYGSDGIAVSLQEFIDNFTGCRSPTLHNKPKLFFIECFPGHKVRSEHVLNHREWIHIAFTGYSLNSSCEVKLSRQLDTDSLQTDDPDFLLANCTYAGKTAPVNESTYMLHLCDDIKRRSRDTHDVLKIINDLHMELCHYGDSRSKICLSLKSTLKKLFVLKSSPQRACHGK